MARDPHSRIVRGEAQAFQKLQQAMRHAIEACAEIGGMRSDRRWSKLGLVFEKLLAQVTALYTRSALDSVTGYRPN